MFSFVYFKGEFKNVIRKSFFDDFIKNNALNDYSKLFNLEYAFEKIYRSC